MDPTSFKEMASFAGVIIPVMVAFIWGGRLLLAWFTQTLDKKDNVICTQQEQVNHLVAELVSVMRETQASHITMIASMGESRLESARAHQAIVETLQRMASSGG